MNILEDSEDSNYPTCTQCSQKILNYSIQLCRRQFLFHSQKSIINNNNIFINEVIDSMTSGNYILDEFIINTQINSKYCDDFIEWIPHSNLENVKHLTNGGNSVVYYGTWNLLLNMSFVSLINVALKIIKDSDIKDILNELQIHHKCRNPRVIPFYGITKSPEGNDYAMVIKHAEYGDLREYIRTFYPKLTWTDRAKILIELSEALNSLHQKNLVHRDFHCKNILIDKDVKVFISDFGLCQPIDSEIVSDSIEGVLPYIAPEVLRYNPYTKQSEVYSISMIMWELTSNEPPFSYWHHDVGLVFAILDEMRPEIIEGTPDCYVKIMQQCWNSDPLQRPDASLLPKLFEEMMELCKLIDIINNNTAQNITNHCLLLPQPNAVTDSENIELLGYDTKAFEYTQDIPLDDCSAIEDRISVTNEANIAVATATSSDNNYSVLAPCTNNSDSDHLASFSLSEPATITLSDNNCSK
ncbi:hypothetical protein RclHR1_01060017 [Rhizophagus clarus]|uniref:Kinase-like domain-containing protein n=1 Tax=Rhizophagus clarus TaxID=94130 RepID=A0A2Z6Q203_9GLOM|nr:hypothetical protein RclHR1_01060017 [Rhizophagus clarus]GES77921.1 kinase-like domain-containing protein [Rhizophagus clarus]